MAFLNKGLRLTLSDERPEHEDTSDEPASSRPRPWPRATGDGGEAAPTLEGTARIREVSYRYDDGLVDFVKHLNARKGEAHRSIIAFEAESERVEGENPMSLEIAMQWNTSFTESVYTFANTINTHEGGTHEEGFRAALTTLVNKFARDWGILKEKDTNLAGEDIREGLTAIVCVKLAEPQFEGQTKTKLGNTEAKAFVQKLVQRAARRRGSRRTPARARTSPARRSRRRGPRWPRARPATWPATARASSAAAGCPAS